VIRLAPPAGGRTTVRLSEASAVNMRVCGDIFGFPLSICAFAATTATGVIEIDGTLECDGVCEISINPFLLELEDFHIGNFQPFWSGFAVSSAAILLEHAVGGQIDADGNLFVSSGGSFGVFGALNDFPRFRRVRPSTPIVARYDSSTRTFSAELRFANEDETETVEASLIGTVANLPPRADAGPSQVVECTGQLTQVALDGSKSSDPDMDSLRFLWSSERQGAFGVAPDVSLPVGSSSWTLRVHDGQTSAEDSTSVTVRDTQAPEIVDFVSNAPVCVWPPNHKYVVLDVARDFSTLLVDVCDPTPELIFKSAHSSQPDDGVGDGSTTNDVVVFPDHVCIRAERAGADHDGREYRLQLVARDASGNEADPTITVRVPHDQRHDSRCGVHLDELETADDGDPRCDPALAEEAWAALKGKPGTSEPETASTAANACMTVDQARRHSTIAWILLVGAVLLRRRSRAHPSG
jgi:hypothetical protein